MHMQALTRQEVSARSDVFLYSSTAGGENKLTPLDGNNAAHHVDRWNAHRAVIANLTNHAKCLGTKSRGALATPALTQQTDVLGAPNPRLTLTALGDDVEGILLKPPSFRSTRKKKVGQ